MVFAQAQSAMASSLWGGLLRRRASQERKAATSDFWKHTSNSDLTCECLSCAGRRY